MGSPVAARELWPLLATVWEPVEDEVSDSHPQKREPLWKSRAPGEKV